MKATTTRRRGTRRQAHARLNAAVAIVPLCFAFACGSPPKKVAMPTPAAAADPDATETVEEAPEKPYAYSPVGKRDPFRDPTKFLVAGTKPAGPEGSQPLQKFDLDQLRLAFTNTATSAPLAMVIDPTGISHFVHIGDFIGKNWGKVSAIKREEITITELITDPVKGTAFPQFLPLRMPKSEIERQADSNLQLVWSNDEGKPDQKPDAPASRAGDTHDAHQN